MKTAAVVIALLVSSHQCAFADDLASVSEAVVVGFGAADCAGFAKSYKERPDDEEMFLLTWISGYLSGLNKMAMTTNHDMKNLNPFSTERERERAFSRIKVFCDQHPLLSITEQLDAMWNALPSIKDTAH